MHVHPSQINGVDAAKQHSTARGDAQSKSGGVSFAEQLASASKAKSSSTPKEPKGEKTAAVAGHSDYRDIVAGPRDGMFLNTSGNKRDGMAFVLVKRHGIEYHIYGTGKDRQVVEIKPHKRHHHTTTPPASTAPTSSSGTTDTSSTTTSSATQSTPTA
jgi:hypothetical protein